MKSDFAGVRNSEEAVMIRLNELSTYILLMIFQQKFGRSDSTVKSV